MSFGSVYGHTLFLDMDGVMADFDGAFAPRFGFDHRDVPDEKMWYAINTYGTYFRDLPPCPGAREFFRTVRRLNPIMLTACPPSNFANVAKQKRGWIAEHLGDVPVIFTPGGKTKGLYLNRPGDILIDDFERNIERWVDAGGFGIHHTGDFAATRDQLVDYLRDAWLKNPSASGTSRAPSADHKTTSPDTTMDTATASDVSTTSQPKGMTAWCGIEPIAQVHLRD